MFKQIRNVLARSIIPKFPVPEGYFSTVEEWSATASSQPFRNQLTVHPAHPGEILYRKEPVRLGADLHPKFACELKKESPPTFVLEYLNGRCWGQAGTIITPDNYVLAEMSHEFRDRVEDYFIFSQQSLPQPVHLSGTAVVLSAPAGYVFGHFLFDILPQLAILEKAGLDWMEADHYLISGPYTGFQKEVLDLLGIDPQKVIDATRTPHVTADRLLIPSRPGVSGNYPAWAVQYLRDLLGPFAGRLPNGITPRLLVSRSLASGRKILNEDELFGQLVPHGFSLIHNEKLSIPETIAVYQQAEVVVGPMGSSMCSTLFCEPGTKVVETYPESSVNVFTWAFGIHIPLEFAYLIGPCQSDPTKDRHNWDYTIEMSELLEILRCVRVDL